MNFQHTQLNLEARMAKTAAKNTSSTARASRKPKADKPVVVNHAENLAADDSLDNLLAELEAGQPVNIETLEAGAPAAQDAADEVIEQTGDGEGFAAEEAPAIVPTGAAATAELTEEEVEHALGHVEAIDAAVAAATVDGADDGAAPTGEASDAPPAEKADDKPKAQRKYYANKVDRIKDRLGAGASEYTVLTLADAGVTEEDLQKVMADTFSIIEKMNKKEQNRAGFLFDFLSGKRAKLNNVLETTLKVLHRDSHVTLGKTSNLIAELVNKPYSMGSARAMSGNTVGMFRDLKILLEDGKGRYVANPESTLLAAVNAKLNLGAAQGAST